MLDDFDHKHLYGVARESLRARILSFMEANNLKHNQVRVVIPRLWLEGVEIELGDVEGVVIEYRKSTSRSTGVDAGTERSAERRELKWGKRI